jgi:hypothetical protein
MLVLPLVFAMTTHVDPSAVISKVKDPVIRAGLDAAINKNLLPAMTQEFYPGFFNISADGGAYGGGASWPGLDSWQMIGAYLMLGKTQVVLDYFEFVKASQRKDGNIPFAIFTGDTQAGGCLRGLKVPQDIYTYNPPKREGVPASAQVPRQWIGLFEHWLKTENALAALGPVCYILTANEISNFTHSKEWLSERLPSLDRAAQHLLSLKSENGLISGSGFYVELPPRFKWDGITQCYTVYAFKTLSKLYKSVGNDEKATYWGKESDTLKKAFVKLFWKGDHFAEYIHPDHGVVDTHGLADVNFAAIALNVADSRQCKKVWPLLKKDAGFWKDGKPTQTVTKPFTYEKWELNAPVGWEVAPFGDQAAMGRVWYLDAMASVRMKDWDRLKAGATLVSQMATDGYWRERYRPQPDGDGVEPGGAEKYCEYAAILTRVVLGNLKVFTK